MRSENRRCPWNQRIHKDKHRSLREHHNKEFPFHKPIRTACDSACLRYRVSDPWNYRRHLSGGRGLRCLKNERFPRIDWVRKL